MEKKSEHLEQEGWGLRGKELGRAGVYIESYLGGSKLYEDARDRIQAKGDWMENQTVAQQDLVAGMNKDH